METSDIISLLGYTDRWMNLGVIDDDTLKQQWEKYCKSDDRNPEHYRFGAFVEFLAKKEHFTDTDIQKILGLDEDTALGDDLRDSRLIAFVESGGLTDSQFQALASERAIRPPPVFKKYKRERVFRDLRTKGIDEISRSRIRASNDKFMHEVLLASKDATAQDIEWLIRHGANKGLRTRARKIRDSQARG